MFRERMLVVHHLRKYLCWWMLDAAVNKRRAQVSCMVLTLLRIFGSLSRVALDERH